MAVFTPDDVGKQFYTVARRFVPGKHREPFILSVLTEGAGVSIEDIPFRKERHRQQVQAELDRLAAL